jgi:hypothetical protein
LQDLSHLATRLGDLRLNRRSLDGKEADQVLRRRKQNDVLDALVVGERSLVGGDGGEIVVEGRGHFLGVQKQKPPGLSALAVSVGNLTTLSRSPPPAGSGNKRKRRKTDHSCCAFKHGL